MQTTVVAAGHTLRLCPVISAGGGGEGCNMSSLYFPAKIAKYGQALYLFDIIS